MKKRADTTRPRPAPLATAALALLLASCGGGEGEPGEGGEADVDVDAPVVDEANDAIESAQEISPGEPFALRIQPAGDVDWYRVEVPGAGYLRASVGRVPDAVDLEVAFARHTQWEEEKERWLREWAEPPVAVRVPEGGIYSIALSDAYDDNASETPIQVRVDYLEEFDPAEPNDEPAAATGVTLDEVRRPAIFPSGDRDWFRVTVPGRGYLTVEARNAPGEIEPEIRLARFDEWAGETTEVRDWHAPPASAFVQDSGAYYVEIRDAYDDGAAETPFEVRIRLLEDVDPAEPNDGPEDAASLQVPDSVAVAIFPDGDRDWFRFQAGSAGTLAIRAVGETGETEPEVRLHRPSPEGMGETEEIGDWQGLPAEVEVPDAGEYLLELRDAYDDQGHPEAFGLQVRRSGGAEAGGGEGGEGGGEDPEGSAGGAG